VRAIRRYNENIPRRQIRALKVDSAREPQGAADRKQLGADKDQASDPHDVWPKVVGPTQRVATYSLLRHTNVVGVVQCAGDWHGSVEEARIHRTNVDWCSTAFVLVVQDRKRFAKNHRIRPAQT
jgi:hypothetical protein